MTIFHFHQKLFFDLDTLSMSANSCMIYYRLLPIKVFECYQLQLVHQPLPWLCVLSASAAFLCSLGECFFNSSVVGLPWSLNIWQFCLFFVFKFVVVLLLVVWGSEVFLPMSPPWLELLGCLLQILGVSIQEQIYLYKNIFRYKCDYILHFFLDLVLVNHYFFYNLITLFEISSAPLFFLNEMT